MFFFINILYMLPNSLKKHLTRLAEKKYRMEANEFVIEGVKGVQEALAFAEVATIVAVEDFLKDVEMKELIKSAKDSGVPVFLCGLKDVTSFQTTATFPGVLATVKRPQIKLNDFSKNSPIVCLDGVKDPGNLGTVIRTADWFGIKNILLSEDTVDPFNEKVVRSTMGSLFHTKIVKSENIVSDLLKLSAKYTLVGLDIKGEDVSKMTPTRNSIYVFGSESHGLRPEVDNMLAKRYTIPGKGKAESLNIGIAAGILLFSISK